MSEFRLLFSPVKIGNLDIENRIVLLPMTTGYAEADEQVGDRMINFFAERAKGGPGLMVAPFSPVNAGSPVEPGLYDDRFIKGAAQLTASVHKFGPKFFCQLITSYHVILNKGIAEVVGPSAVWNTIMRCNPRPLSIDEIHFISEEYGMAAARSREAGFDGVEILVGGGYLLNRFLSPIGNQRDDDYGGSPENRLRIILEILASIRSKAGNDFPVNCRLTLDEQMKDGLKIDDIKDLAVRLERAGVAAITSYTGWHESPVPTVQASVPKAAFTHLTQKLKSWVNIPVIASNRINDPETAERLLAEKKADLIGMARAMMADPEFPRKARDGRANEIVPCLACSECIADAISGYRDWGKPIAVSCSINPAAGKEGTSKLQAAELVKDIWIIGGGPGGMEAAIEASLRGHRVKLFEKGPELGGKLLVAKIPPFKDAVADLVNSFRVRLKKAGVEIFLNREITAEEAAAARPDVLILAVGAVPVIPPIPGMDSGNTVLVEDVLTGRRSVSGKVLIIGGGMVGCETAEFLLAEKAITGVTVLEMLDKIAENISSTYRPFFLSRLKKAGIAIETNTKICEISSRGLKVEQSGVEKFIEGDSIILAVGYEPDPRMARKFEKAAEQFHLIGDCSKAGLIRDAVEQGFLIGREV